MTKVKIMVSSAPSNSAKADDRSRLLKYITIDRNNNHDDADDSGNHYVTAGKRQTASILFKHQTNASRQDIDALRALVSRERGLQRSSIDRGEFDFYRADFERLLSDDWLATRFLLRGKKAHERELQSDDGKLLVKLFDDVTTQVDQTASQKDGQRARREQSCESPIMRRTLELVKVCARFRFDYQINNQTQLEEFPREWVKVDGLFHYKPDLVGNPTAYLRVALHRPKLIETAEARHQFKRLMLYTLERCDQELYNKPGKAICCVFDMTNVAFENIDLELTSWMIKSFKSSSPKLLCYVIVYNPPWFFTATLKVICNTLLSNSKRQSVKIVYGNEILNYIDHTNLPPYLKSTIR